MKIRIDPVSCAGHGVCAELLPELIELDDWGYPIVQRAEVPPELDSVARQARALCPALALHLEGAREDRERSEPRRSSASPDPGAAS